MDSPPDPDSRSDGRRDLDRQAVLSQEILSLVEELNLLEDTDEFLDKLAESAARLAGYRRSLLSLTLPEGALVGTWNLPEEDRARFKRRARETNIEYRMEKRERIRSHAYPGTAICFIPHDVDLDRAPLSAEYLELDRPAGTWHLKDRLIILVRGSRGREIGVFSLDHPESGNAPTAVDLDDLRRAERLLAIGGSLLQTRLLEQSLRRSEEEMRALVDDAPVGIYRRSHEGLLLSVNGRLAAVFGYASPEEMVADPAALAGLEPGFLGAEVDALAVGSESPAQEVESRRRDGNPFRLRHSARRLPAREYVLGIVEDVTEASLLEEQLQRARRLQAVGTLASGIAHDFNNLLCGILGYASLIRLRPGLDPRVDSAARAVEEAAVRGADLTRRLLGIAREGPADLRSVELAEVLHDGVRIARETFDRRIEIALDVEPGLPPVRGRASDLHQAFLNLLINARDALPEGGPVHVSAVRTAEGPRSPPSLPSPGGWVRVEVADAGEGMDEATRARLFEPFFTTKQRGKGTGLGLYMVYTTVQAHGGVVEIDSAPGAGARIAIYLPEGTREAGTVLEAPAAEATSAPPARILVVEDEEMLRELSLEILTDRGHSVVLAKDGKEAVDLLEEPGAAFDLVVLDLVLPRLSGAEVFRRLRHLHPQLPVILSSGNIDDGMLDQDLRGGVAGVLSKPYRPSELAAAVARVLGKDTGGG